MKYLEIEAKSILVPTNLPGADYVVNPYIGCQFGCAYCYACFMGRFVKESRSDWGNYVYVKTNSLEVLPKDLQRVRRKSPAATVFLSSVTDPYQGLERKYKITRGILRYLADENYDGSVSLLTKSPMVLRDLDILNKISDVEVGVTVTTTDDVISRWLEARAPSSMVRLNLLRKLSDAGIKTYAFVGPLLPHYRERPDLLRALFGNLRDVGVRDVFVEHINLQRSIRQRLGSVLAPASPEVRAIYSHANSHGHRQALNDLIYPMLSEFSLNLRLGEIIEHGK